MTAVSACKMHCFASPPCHALSFRPSRRWPRRRSSVIRCVKPGPLVLSPSLVIDPPVILSPMAGITNYPFRRLCKKFGAALYVSEMVHAQFVLRPDGDVRARFGPGELPRSAQLYGMDPVMMAEAATVLIQRDGAQHIDLNFGCPIRKVLRAGGGAAIPTNLPLLRSIAESVVNAARPYGVPITAKIRLGLDWRNATYLDAGRVLQDAGIVAITLHSRTAADGYAEGFARRGWVHIWNLVNSLDIPVLGNGDIFTATDALKMIASTGAAGVVIGRGCLGRPWIFRDLADAFRTGWSSETTVPEFEYVARTLVAHVQALVDWEVVRGDAADVQAAVRAARKWPGYYLQGYTGLPKGLIRILSGANSVGDMRKALAEVDPEKIGYNYGAGVGARGKMGMMPLPKKEPRPPPPKQPKSASQRKPKTAKGKIQAALRELAQKKRDKEEAAERRAEARLRLQRDRIGNV